MVYIYHLRLALCGAADFEIGYTSGKPHHKRYDITLRYELLALISVFPQRALMSRHHYKANRASGLAKWRALTAACHPVGVANGEWFALV